MGEFESHVAHELNDDELNLWNGADLGSKNETFICFRQQGFNKAIPEIKRLANED